MILKVTISGVYMNKHILNNITINFKMMFKDNNWKFFLC